MASPKHADRLAGELGHGQKQWLEIGMVLASDPKVLMLDEPVAGLTDEETERTAALVRRLNRPDRAIVVVEHDMDFVERIADRVTVLHEGRTAVRRADGQGPRRCRRHRGLSGALTMQFRVEALDQHYGSSQVLRHVGLEIAPGECMAVLGRNGAGKTDAAQMRHGADRADLGQGAARRRGCHRHGRRNRRSRAGVAYVPQGREIFSELTVGENIEAAARAHGTYGTPVMEEAVALFPVLREMWKRSGGALSGGQQQQLAIARALVTQPRLLILDEPTEGIQPNIVAAIGEVLRSLKGRLSILLVEQYLDFAIETADAFVILSRGAVVESGRAEAMSREHLTRFIAV